eukprot:TRINITY_DN2223_c0_g1_i17.p3 TRINITY_DN2223_c0_g1~~TRINITY_DN2223_c0_g1_i17.p3  ORF type:complete len:100 (-),score=19.67 TRINITY_DN2223_c0_g1_i17:92-391(-)
MALCTYKLIPPSLESSPTMFKFVKHGPDIERSLAIFVSLENTDKFVDTFWKECIAFSSDQPQIEPDGYFGDIQPGPRFQNTSISPQNLIQDEYGPIWDM